MKSNFAPQDKIVCNVKTVLIVFLPRCYLINIEGYVWDIDNVECISFRFIGFLHKRLIAIFSVEYFLSGDKKILYTDLTFYLVQENSFTLILLFILITAIISNLTQFKLGGPAFGGMSGVVYGLFGYVWIKSKFDPGDGLFIHQTTALIMLGWFFLCFVVKDFGVANWAHAGGLITGSAWGYISAFRWNRK